MACMCGSTSCPPCGPAQGYDPSLQALMDRIYVLCEADCPPALDLEWLAAYVCDKFLMLTAAEREAEARANAEAEARWHAEYLANPFLDLPPQGT